MSVAKKLEQYQPSRTAGRRSVFEFNRRVLIVEDENEIASSYQKILSPETDTVRPIRRSTRSRMNGGVLAEKAPRQRIPPFEVSVANNVKDALALVEKAVADGKPFAMGFFDVMLGDKIDGIELVRRIHEIDPEIYAVFVTAYHDRSAESIHEILGEDKADRWDYLNKPFTESEILQKSRNAVSIWNLHREKQLRDHELNEAHKILLQSDRLASVAAVARGVGHEFGNILVQIMGRAELSLDGSDEEKRKALETILKASETASHILSKFKNLAKPSNDAIDLRQIRLNDPLEEALMLLEHQLKMSEIEVELTCEEDLEVHACHPLLVQVFVNLLINAVHAIERRGKIVITAAQRDDHAVVTLLDSGPGIPPEILHQVMEPFFTTKRETGTGLGLAITREIIEVDHGGKIAVENDLQGGARFIIHLPLTDR